MIFEQDVFRRLLHNNATLQHRKKVISDFSESSKQKTQQVKKYTKKRDEKSLHSFNHAFEAQLRTKKIIKITFLVLFVGLSIVLIKLFFQFM